MPERIDLTYDWQAAGEFSSFLWMIRIFALIFAPR